ncbi:transposase, partial [Caedibacter taeniospiralis]
MKRPPIALSKLKHYDGKNITFQYLNHRNGKYKTANMDIDHF